jgi:hypothetical protein
MTGLKFSSTIIAPTQLSTLHQNETPQSVYGYATGDDIFSLADLIFVQEYFNQAPILGSQGEVTDGI